MASQVASNRRKWWLDRKKAIAVAVIGLLAVAIVVTAEITAGGGLWRLTLSAQLQGEKRCRLDKVLSYQEFKVGGELTRKGRVRCLDAREFSFARGTSQPQFELRLCQSAKC